MLVGLDIGRSSTKICTDKGKFHFPSLLGEWRERKLQSNFGTDGMEVEFNGQKYFAGTLAKYESEFVRSMMTEDKAHEDTLLLALIALHKANVENAFVITGLPVENHIGPNKNNLKNLLLGEWEIVVNNVKKKINISRVEVAVEGGAAFWVHPKEGLIRIIDGGSRTINYVTMIDKRYIDKESGTIPIGFDTTKSNNPQQLAAKIAGELGKKWAKNDTIWVIGGQANLLTETLAKYFSNIKPVNDPLYANAMGFYRIGQFLK